MRFERQCLAGMIYGRREGGVELTLDLYMPDLPDGHPRPIPAVLYFHGGGWVRGSAGSPSSVYFALEMAAEGVAVACVNYRLAPAHIAPAAIEDAKLAVRWLRSEAESFGIDPKRLVAMGNSAGGHLALMLALTQKSDSFDGPELATRSSAVMAAVDLCGIADVADYFSHDFTPPWVQSWVPPDLDEHMALARKCSPVEYARGDAPPILTVHAKDDPAVPFAQSERLHAKLAEAGADAELVALESGGHMLGVTGSPDVQRQVRAARQAFFRRLNLIGEPAGVA